MANYASMRWMLSSTEVRSSGKLFIMTINISRDKTFPKGLFDIAAGL